MSFIEGGVCAPKGFQASGVICGIRPNPVKNDLAVVASDEACTCAGVFTRNVVKAAPVLLDMETVKLGGGLRSQRTEDAAAGSRRTGSFQ